MADKGNGSDDSDLYSECQMPLPPLPKKRRTIIFTKCIICQTDLKDKLRKGKETSVANFVSKLNVRRDSVYKRLSPDLELLYELKKTKFFGTPPAMRRTQVLNISNMPLQVKHQWW